MPFSSIYFYGYFWHLHSSLFRLIKNVKNFWNGIVDIVNGILSAVMMMLPDSPFANVEIPDEVKQILGYVNYFVPIGAMLAIAAAWLSAIGIYYLVQTILRWAKAIK